MFSGLSIVSGVVSIFNKVVTYFSNKQLINAGAAEQVAADAKNNKVQEVQVNAVKNTVDAGSDIDTDKLSNKWTRGGS
jgi:chromosome condensin MukBEF MukE localization factor